MVFTNYATELTKNTNKTEKRTTFKAINWCTNRRAILFNFEIGFQRHVPFLQYLQRLFSSRDSRVIRRVHTKELTDREMEESRGEFVDSH